MIKKLLFLRKQVTTYLLEFQRIDTFHYIELLILNVSVESLFNFDHEQWRVK